MKKSRLNAVSAERLFGIVILLLLIGLVADFIFVTNFLKSEATKTEVLRKHSDASDTDITKLKSADEWLKKNDDVVRRTSAVVAQSKLYQYQNQIIEDFNGYGRQAGVPILGFSFIPSESASGTKPTPAASPPATTTPSTAASASSAATTAKAPAGVNSITVTVACGEKVNYQNFLNLLRLLEQNITRMQVTTISLTPDLKDPTTIANPNITVIVYTR